MSNISATFFIIDEADSTLQRYNSRTSNRSVYEAKSQLVLLFLINYDVLHNSKTDAYIFLSFSHTQMTCSLLSAFSSGKLPLPK